MSSTDDPLVTKSIDSLRTVSCSSSSTYIPFTHQQRITIGDVGQKKKKQQQQQQQRKCTCDVGTTSISKNKESLWFESRQLSNTYNNIWCSSTIQGENHFWRPKAYLLGDAKGWFLARSQHMQD